MLKILDYPYPYRCWLTISNDPDGTRLQDWEELHEFIWETLALPLADSFFLCSYNETFPDQVNLRDHPQILSAHAHDTMHTWGDFCQTRHRKFSREDAIEGLQTLRNLNVSPRVWTDHSCFSGNLIHRSIREPAPKFVDDSGLEYDNFEYTLDLIGQAGVRYIWDGKVSRTLGQDRHISRYEWYADRISARSKRVAYTLVDYLFPKISRRLWSDNKYEPETNRQYFARRFGDGQRFYCFRRYGRSRLADIDGLGQLLSPATIDRFAAAEGTAIVYTHLGKRRADRRDDHRHIPTATQKALQELARRYRQGEMMLSSTSDLLDYLVIRDHAQLSDGIINFVADGVRFETLTANDLQRFEFAVRGATPQLQVLCEGEPLACSVQQVDSELVRLSFAAHTVRQSQQVVSSYG